MVFNQIRRLYITLDATDKATRKLKQVDQAANATSMQMQNAAAAAQKYRARLVAAGFAATMLGTAIAGMVRNVKNVDRTFATISAVTGATADQMGRIRNEAAAIGAEMPVRIGDAAKAFRELAYAGFDVQQSLEASNDVVEMSIAGNIKMADAARTASSALNAFSLEAEEVGQVTNSMAAVFTSSALNMQEMTQSLQYVMPSANATGQSLQQLGAAIGTLADQGLRGTRAGTAMDRVLRGLTEAAQGGSDALAKLGMQTSDIVDEEGNLKSMHLTIQALEEGVNSLSQVEGFNALQEMFGQRGARAAALLVENTDKFIEKIGQQARAEINATFRDLRKMDEEGLKEINATLDMISEDMGIDPIQFSGDESTEEIVSQFNQISDEVDQDQLAEMIDNTFAGISTESAEIFAGDVMDDSKAVEDIAYNIDEMTTSADIAEEQMESLWGQIEYIMGSLDSLQHQLVIGMGPALELFFEGLIAVVDVLTEYPKIARGVGMGMAALLTIFTLIAAKSLVLATYFWMVASGTFQSGMAAYFHAGASRVLAGAKMQLNAILPITIFRTQAEAAANRSAASATFLGRAANLAKISSLLVLNKVTATNAGITRFRAMQLAIANNHQILSTALSYRDAIAKKVQTAATLGLSGALGVATAAMYALTAAMLANPITALITGFTILISLLWSMEKFDFLGLGDEAGGMLDAILAPLWWLIDATKLYIAYIDWMLTLFWQIGELAVVAFFAALAGTLEWAGDQVARLVNWYKELNWVGKLVIGVLLPIIPILLGLSMLMGWLSEQVDKASEAWADFKAELGDEWAALGLAIGDAIRNYIIAPLAYAGSLWDRFTGGADDMTSDVGDALKQFFVDVEMWLYGLPGRFYEWGTSLLPTMGEGILSTDVDLKAAMMTALSNAFYSLMPGSDAQEGPLSNLTSWGAAIPGTIADGIRSAGGAVKHALGSVLDVAGEVGSAIASAAGVAKSKAKRLGESVADGIKNGIQDAGSKVVGAVDSVTGGLASDAIGGVTSAAGGVVDAVKNPAETAQRAADVAQDTGIATGNIDKMGQTAMDVGGAVAQRHPASNAAQTLGSKAQETVNDITESNDIHFHGEVHDVQKVDQKVNDAIKDASQESVKRVEDILDMGKDAIGGGD